MKGKSTFTIGGIKKLEELITLRIKSRSSNQKSIRQKMRNLGFYGQDDWGIIDLKIADLHSLIKSGRIKVIGGSVKPIAVPVNAKDKVVIKTNTIAFPISNSVELTAIIENFKLNRFDPQIDS